MLEHGGVVAMAEREVVRYASRSSGVGALLSSECCVKELWKQFLRKHFIVHGISAIRCVLRRLFAADERKECVKRRRAIGRQCLVYPRCSPEACMGSKSHLRGEANELHSKSPQRGSPPKGTSAHTRGWMRDGIGCGCRLSIGTTTLPADGGGAAMRQWAFWRDSE
jgi:hypothetical protein